MRKYIDITPHIKTSTQTLLTTPLKSKTSSKEPNDGIFIQYLSKDGFNAKGTVRYGEETDADAI